MRKLCDRLGHTVKACGPVRYYLEEKSRTKHKGTLEGEEIVTTQDQRLGSENISHAARARGM